MSEAEAQAKPLVQGRELSKLFSARPGLFGVAGRRFVRAVDRVSLAIEPAEVVGLVGESGCGKSTLGRMMVCLEAPSAGQVLFEGEDITSYRGRGLRKYRRQMQIIFQDASTSLNPRYTVRDTLAEAVRVHRRRLGSRQLNTHVAVLLDMVGLPIAVLDRYPWELSGGEHQRIAIARALAVEPRFITADEPVAALDLSSQAQIVDLLTTVRKELNVALLLIAHDLDVVRALTSRVAVMYLGRLLEIAPTAELLDHPRHPYTRALTAATLAPEPSSRKPAILPGEPPSPLDPPTGCHFHPRCPHAEVRCELVEPEMHNRGPAHQVKCHFDLS